MAHPATAAVIFAFTYAAVALGGVPGLRIDRTGAAAVGAAFMVAFQVVTPDLTLLGSIANLIVAEGARRVSPLGFVEYLKVGVPVTLLTLAAGLLLLS